MFSNKLVTWLLVIQATLRRNVAMKDPRFDPELAAAVHASTQFKVGDKALFVARSNYGALATVLPNPSTGLSREVSKHINLRLYCLFGKRWSSAQASSLAALHHWVGEH